MGVSQGLARFPLDLPSPTPYLPPAHGLLARLALWGGFSSQASARTVESGWPLQVGVMEWPWARDTAPPAGPTGLPSWAHLGRGCPAWKVSVLTRAAWFPRPSYRVSLAASLGQGHCWDCSLPVSTPGVASSTVF